MVPSPQLLPLHPWTAQINYSVSISKEALIGSWQGKHHTLPLPSPLQHSYGWPYGFILQDLEFPLFPVCLHIAPLG